MDSNVVNIDDMCFTIDPKANTVTYTVSMDGDFVPSVRYLELNLPKVKPKNQAKNPK